MNKIKDIFKKIQKKVFKTKTLKKRRKKIKQVNNTSKGLMELDEALKVFNFEKLDFERELLEEKFKSMYDNNSLENGGSLYIQAKVSIARNTILSQLGVDLNVNEKLEKAAEENIKTEENGNSEKNIENENENKKEDEVKGDKSEKESNKNNKQENQK